MSNLEPDLQMQSACLELSHHHTRSYGANCSSLTKLQHFAVFPWLYFKLPVCLSSQEYESWEEGNHRQWCGPLQGKPRYGGIPLRKSTPAANDCSCRYWDRPDRRANHISRFIRLKPHYPISDEVRVSHITPLAYSRQGRIFACFNSTISGRWSVL